MIAIILSGVCGFLLGVITLMEGVAEKAKEGKPIALNGKIYRFTEVES